ncbi:MAG: hypothetical protein ACWGOX_06440, partial [Desulforhopalus sp.]
MPQSASNKKLIDEIELYIQYAVPESDLHSANVMVERYRRNRLVLRVLREHYLVLPEAREEAVVRIAHLVERQGVKLIVVSAASHSYLYLVSSEHVLFVGEYQQEVDVEILSFFEFDCQETFLKKCIPVEKLKEYAATESEQQVCPACGVSEGDYHLAGCAVEVCPWCEGHLANCNCRFEQLGIDEIEHEEQLEEFLDLLSAKGRIPFRKEQAPAFPGTSEG